MNFLLQKLFQCKFNQFSPCPKESIYSHFINQLLEEGQKNKFFSKNVLTLIYNHVILIHVDKTSQHNILEVYPSLAEGIGLENRQAGNTARGFESLYLLHFKRNPLLYVAVFFCSFLIR